MGRLKCRASPEEGGCLRACRCIQDSLSPDREVALDECARTTVLNPPRTLDRMTCMVHCMSLVHPSVVASSSQSTLPLTETIVDYDNGI